MKWCTKFYKCNTCPGNANTFIVVILDENTNQLIFWPTEFLIFFIHTIRLCHLFHLKMPFKNKFYEYTVTSYINFVYLHYF